MANIPELGEMNLVHLKCFDTRAHTHTRVGRDGLGSSSTFSHTHWFLSFSLLNVVSTGVCSYTLIFGLSKQDETFKIVQVKD